MTINFKEEIKKDMRESGFNVHKRYDHLSIPELRYVCKKDQNPFYVCALSVTGDLNIGSMIRTASLYGAEKFYIFGRRKYDKRGTVGANNYIEVVHVEGLVFDADGVARLDHDLFISMAISEGMTPIFVEQGGEALGSFNWVARLQGITNPCLVFGNENRGIPIDILDYEKYLVPSFLVSIPQKGVIRSHNVSVSSGIVMHDMCSSMGWL